MRHFNCLKDKVTPERTMFFQSEKKDDSVFGYWVISGAFKSIRSKRTLFDGNRLKNKLYPRIAGNHLRPTGKRLETLCLVLHVMWPVCIFFPSPLFVNFHKKKMWALKVEKDGHDPNTLSTLKEILRLVIICQGKFSVYFSVDHFHFQYITFQLIVNND